MMDVYVLWSGLFESHDEHWEGGPKKKNDKNKNG